MAVLARRRIKNANLAPTPIALEGIQQPEPIAMPCQRLAAPARRPRAHGGLPQGEHEREIFGGIRPRCWQHAERNDTEHMQPVCGAPLGQADEP